MKTLKLITLAGILVVTSLVRSYAGDNDGLQKAYNQLNAQLKAVIEKMPLTTDASITSSAFLVVSFSVNKNSEIENVSVESSDDKLADNVEQVLSKEKIKVNPLLDGKYGQVALEI